LGRDRVDIQIIFRELSDKYDRVDANDLALLHQWSSSARLEVTKGMIEANKLRTDNQDNVTQLLGLADLFKVVRMKEDVRVI
jgi:hypothetical protein